MIEPSALARCTDAMKDTSQSLSRHQQARNVFKQSSSAVGGEHFGLGALAGEAVGAGRGEAITLCPVVVVRGKEGCMLMTSDEFSFPLLGIVTGRVNPHG